MVAELGFSVQNRVMLHHLHRYINCAKPRKHYSMINCIAHLQHLFKPQPNLIFMSFFITFEGIEGSGKSTQLQRLLEHLHALGYQAATTREPGGCPISDVIRTLLLDPENDKMASRTELLLYGAARAQHVVEFIRPTLAAGKIVLCDRFSDATIVYQGAGRGLEMTQLRAIDHFATDGLIPDLTLLLDYPAEAGLQRARERNHFDDLESEGRFELESLAFHQRIRQGYLDLAAREERFHIIDALGDVETVAKSINAVIDRFFASRRPA